MKRREGYWILLGAVGIMMIITLVSQVVIKENKTLGSAKGDTFPQAAHVEVRTIVTDHSSVYIQPIDSFSVDMLPQKWERYNSFEELQELKQMNLYVPGELPAGFIFQKIEFLDGLVKAIYHSNDGWISFSQSTYSVDEGIMEEEWQEADGQVKGTWFENEMRFELIGANVQQEELHVIRQSLFPLVSEMEEKKLSFQVIGSAWYMEHFRPQNRAFRLFTPQQFYSFVQDEKLIFPYKHNPNADELIIGLFGGEKGSSGYAIITEQVFLRDQRLDVVFREEGPRFNHDYLAVITYPSQFITVELEEGEKPASVQFITSSGVAIANLRYGGE